jgi:hypothetical protein
MGFRAPRTYKLDESLIVKASDITDGNAYQVGPHTGSTTPANLFSGGTVTDGYLGLFFAHGVSDADQTKIDADEAPLSVSLTVDFHNAAGDVVASFSAVSTPTAADGDSPAQAPLVPIPTDLEVSTADVTVADGANNFDSLYIGWVAGFLA